jgi:hypothetical protein
MDLVRSFNLLLSGLALIGMATSIVAIVLASSQIWNAFHGLRLVAMLAFFVAICIGSFCGSAALWLGARPHRAATMRLWRRGFWVAWAAGVSVALLLWVLA